MRGRKIDPANYSVEMQSALEIILDECAPGKTSSRKAASVLYREIRKLMPLARPKQIAAEAIWIGREEYPTKDLRIGHFRDRAIRQAISMPMAIERAEK